MMKIFILKVQFVLSILQACNCLRKECVLSLHKDLPRQHEPLYFVQNGDVLDIVMPQMIGDDGLMTLQSGQKLILSCAGRNNKLLVSGNSSTLTECAGGIMLNINDRPFPTYQLECKSSVQPIIEITNQECGSGRGRELRIGFEKPNLTLGSNTKTTENYWSTALKSLLTLWNLFRKKRQPQASKKSSNWVNMVTACHSMDISDTLYSSHIIYGSSLHGAELKVIRPHFQQGNVQLYRHFNPDAFYRKSHQWRILNRTLGSSKADKFLRDNFISRGHLAPDADFLFGSWQYMTYFFVNSCPQWLSINSGNWQQLEREIRRFAIHTKSNLLITTGTHGVLALQSDKMIYKKIFLHPDGKQMPVPKYLWKVVTDPNKQACIAFVCSNNPFLKRAPPLLCNNICRQAGWTSYYQLNSIVISKGYTFCCQLDELRKEIPTIPEINCQSLLVGLKAFYNYKDHEKSAVVAS